LISGKRQGIIGPAFCFHEIIFNARPDPDYFPGREGWRAVAAGDFMMEFAR
jgi:hypothetical protein